MTLQPEHPFVVGQQYENRKGLFVVLSMDSDSGTMEIRWDTGEEATCPIELQTKILRNMAREQHAATTKKGYRAPRSYGEFFTGLHPGDFSEDVTGTHWRAREQLGGAVTRALAVPEVFDSWSIYKRPEVHWASVTRYRAVAPCLQTKYFVRLNQHEVLFGLYIERSNKRSDNQDDWLRFLAWTGDADNCRWLHHMLLAAGATLTNPYHTVRDFAFYGSVSPVVDGSFHHDAENASGFDAAELPAFHSSLPDDLWLNLLICRKIPRDEAIAHGPRVASTIGDFFMTLLPVYESKRPIEASAEALLTNLA